MGTIQGDLSVLGIAHLLQVLSTNDCEGYLTLQQGTRRKILHLTPAGIRLVRGARRSHPLGQLLVRTGRITRDELDGSLAAQRRTGSPLGDVLTREGPLDWNVVANVLRERVLEEIYDLFTWPEATFTFRHADDGPTPVDEGPLSSFVVDSNVMAIMLEAARRVDELARIRSVIPDVRLVAERLDSPTVPDDVVIDPDAEKEILSLVDGRRSVDQIIEASVYPRFAVLRTLYGLALRGVVRIPIRRESREEARVAVAGR